MRADLVIVNGTVVSPGGALPADLAIADGKITVVANPGQLPVPPGGARVDASGLVVLPGLVDVHVHMYDPGWPDREDFTSGTRAAAAGGITTVFEMPNSQPTVDSVETFSNRLTAVSRRAVVDFGLYGGLGVTNPGTAGALAEAGAVAFKTFRIQGPSGSEQARLEGGLRASDPASMLERLRESAATGLVHAVHAEDHALCEYFTSRARARGLVRPEHLNIGRPEICEIVSTVDTLALAREAGARLHLVHMTAAEAIRKATEARSAGQRVTIETCPQYLCFSEEDMKRVGPYGKIHPPLRSPESRDRLWELVADGSVDVIATDHGPHLASSREEFRHDIFAVPPGHPGFETMLPALLTQVNAGRLRIEKLVALTSENPARIFGLYPRKGAIRVGSDADLTLVDLNKEHVLRASEFFTKGRDVARLFDGMRVRGMPVMTLVRGTLVYRAGVVLGEPGHGVFLRPG